MSGLSADKIFIEKKCRQDRTGISAVGRFSVLVDRSVFPLFTKLQGTPKQNFCNIGHIFCIS
jgi:hypothetical protein